MSINSPTKNLTFLTEDNNCSMTLVRDNLIKSEESTLMNDRRLVSETKSCYCEETCSTFVLPEENKLLNEIEDNKQLRKRRRKEIRENKIIA